MLRQICRTFHTVRLARQFSELKQFENNFLSATNIVYIQSLYESWCKDKASVSKSFATYFELLEKGVDPESAYEKPLALGQKLVVNAASEEIAQQLKMRLMIDQYRTQGHMFANIDPLELESDKDLYGRLDRSILDVETFGYDKNQVDSQIMLKSLREENSDKANGPYTIKAMEEYLQRVYCDKVGFEYMHLLSKDERDFIKWQIERDIATLEKKEPTKEERMETLKRLCQDQCFIDFLGSKFGNYKRFGIEGLNSATSALGQLVESAAYLGAQNIIFGMAHRGRLNALHCVFDKPAQTIFREFLEKSEQDGDMSGDVKYHLGYAHTKTYGDKKVTLNIIPNPSHLEAVNPLVYGCVRALQESKGLNSQDKVFGVLIHGDSAVSGQGVVYESLQMDDLVDYTTGGIIHIVLNNQIGFTTHPKQSRSSYYCTEVAKVVDAPVFHVNGDDPDILDRCIKMAVAYRYKFKKDIFIDIVGYRRHGHNEQDQPNFTQPIMYDKIKNKLSVFETYSQKLVSKGVVTQEEIQALKDGFNAKFEEDYKKVMEDRHDRFTDEDLPIQQIRPPVLWGTKTGVPLEVLADIMNKVTTWPTDFQIHPTIRRIYEERIRTFKHNEPLDWATMESLAFGSLLHEGYGVRLSGQDVERGTFSHRHALISDQKRDVEKHVFLKAVDKNNVTITNSHLSQYGVLGFEYGYTITNPNTLVIWEAQFGDFANGASIIIDNFLVSGQTKWDQPSGLVLNLPHGMDGQGPEHSQGRIERFLHLSDDNCDENQSLSYEEQMEQGNILVVCCSTTSNYFHAMRRQMRLSYRKPLIMFNSKKLLKFRGANRPVSDIIEGTEFQTVYPDTCNAQQVKKVLLCHGQFYYELISKREELNRKDIAIVRIQQLAPYPHQEISKALAPYAPTAKVFWVQEEHENYGAWNYLQTRLRRTLQRPVSYLGRMSSGSTAIGTLKLHRKQQVALLNEIFA